MTRCSGLRVATMFAVACCALALTMDGSRAAHEYAVLPNGWTIERPYGAMTYTDTMPQGAAASPDRRLIAVVESGFNPPTLRLYRASDLTQTASIPLTGAFGRPVWIDGGHVLVAGANADALFDVDVARQSVRTIALPKQSYPTAVTVAKGTVAIATDGDFSVRIGSLDAVAGAKPVRIGGHVGGLAFTPGGGTLFASNWSARTVDAIDAHTLRARTIATSLHPSAVLPVAGTLYVAESDADSIGVYDWRNGTRLANIFVGIASPRQRLDGASPNALAQGGDAIYVSLGAANSVGVIRNRRLVAQIPAGWYPTDVVPIRARLYIVDGKGEGTRANPYFNARNSRSFYDYVAALQYGSIRAYDLTRRASGNTPGALGWKAVTPNTVVRSRGPIRHVFFILKENRSYDQVLGDVRAGNGDPKLTWFGHRVTPNQHALAARFGLFDNAYTSGEVSESGHYWADAAFVNDYIERTWPANYGNRGGTDDTLTGVGTPRNGYIWQAARAARVSFRDYGEMTIPNPSGRGQTAIPSLAGVWDPRYVGWDLGYDDLARVQEWRREFDAYLHRGNVPALEYIWLPNDHTAGSRVGMPTPVAYVAQNDYAVGRIVDAISHSSIWKSSAIFITEDDAQDGPDHVSDQRTTLFVASPYARGGVQHAHYSTVSILRTMEIILGLQPLSAYDEMAVPLDAAFSTTPRLRPYEAIPPKVSITAKNGRHAYGSAISAELNLARPDANPPNFLTDILSKNH